MPAGGKWQRLILEAVSTGPTILTSCDDTESEQVCIRRAAHSLERAGLVTLRSEVVEGRRRLMVYRAVPVVLPSKD